MKDLGVEEAMRPFTVRPTGQEDNDENALEAEDEREFTLAHSQPPRSLESAIPDNRSRMRHSKSFKSDST